MDVMEFPLALFDEMVKRHGGSKIHKTTTKGALWRYTPLSARWVGYSIAHVHPQVGGYNSFLLVKSIVMAPATLAESTGVRNLRCRIYATQGSALPCWHNPLGDNIFKDECAPLIGEMYTFILDTFNLS
jgi:hypothetical protein